MLMPGDSSENSSNNNNGPETEEYLHKVLFVCTASRGLSNWSSGTTGLWFEELSTPYYIFQEVGFDIDIASLNGMTPPVDNACYLSQNQCDSVDRFMEDNDAMSKFYNAPSLRSIVDNGNIASYGCIFLCGGHGAIDDFPNNVDIKRAVEYVYNVTKGCVAAICHGPLGLLACKSEFGVPLLKDKFVAAFSNEEELSLIRPSIHIESDDDDIDEKEDNTTLPIYTETAVDKAGAICVPSPPWHPNAVVDGRLVTGQNPQSSILVGHRVLDVMRSLGEKFSPSGNINKPWGVM